MTTNRGSVPTWATAEAETERRGKFLHQHFDKATGALTGEQVLDHPFPVLNPDVETVKVTVIPR
jgi:hypothetical protein